MATYPDARIVDAIIALVAVEVLIILLWRALTGGGLPVVGTLANLSSGAALLLALRMALTGASFATVLAVLSAALIAHVVDLASRWESARPRLPNEGSSVTLNAGFVLNGRADRLKAVKDLANQVVEDHQCGSPSRSTIP
jgi:hypothetical protein